MSINRNLRKISLVCLALGSMAGLSATASADEFQFNLTIPAEGPAIPLIVPGDNTPVSLTCVQNTEGFRAWGRLRC